MLSAMTVTIVAVPMIFIMLKVLFVFIVAVDSKIDRLGVA
tara:strand:- start:13689 stop:13808 length:120 start_codon:yes stop_codon:yes gene_type:complete